MTDCYDTRTFPQSLIDAILEIWDTADNDGQRTEGIECQGPQDAENVLLAAD